MGSNVMILWKDTSLPAISKASIQNRHCAIINIVVRLIKMTDG